MPKDPEADAKAKVLDGIIAKHEDFCPYIKSCNGTNPDDEPSSDSCPCNEHGAPCWYYKVIYIPTKPFLKG